MGIFGTPGALALLATLGTACATPTLPPLTRQGPVDDAVELAAMLPSGFERCVVSRPHRMPDQRRSLATLRAWSLPWSLDTALRLRAAASATVSDAVGGRARVTFLRFGPSSRSPRDRARRLHVRWEEEPCRARECRRPSARWISPNTLRIRRGRWPRPRPGLGRSETCVAAARFHPRATEVAVDAGIRFRFIPVAVSPTLVRTLHAGRHLEVQTDYRFRNPADARAFEQAQQNTRGRSPEPTATSVLRRGSVVRVTERQDWEELQLSQEDERDRQRALAHRARRAVAANLEEIDFSNVEVVEHQLSLLRRQVAQAVRGERSAAIRELATFLDRAAAALPARTHLAEARARVALDLLEEPAEAVRIAEAVLASGLAREPTRWRVLRREALGQQSLDRLATALREEGLTPSPVEARRAAEDLMQLRESGVTYEWAEGAWALSRQLMARAPRGGAIRARLPWSAVLPTAVALLRLQTSRAASRVLFAVHARRSATRARAIGRSRPELVVLRAPGGGAVLTGASTTNLVELRRVSDQLAAALPEGDMELTLDLGDELTLRMRGRVEAGALQVTWVSSPLLTTRWPLAVRYVARPLENLGVALFPTPELVVRAESEETAVTLRRAVGDGSHHRCVSAGPVVRCRAPGDPDRLGELLLELARARFER